MRLSPVPMITVLCIAMLVAAWTPATAGTMSLAWDPVAGASSYQVHYGTSPSNYSQTVTVTATSATLTNLSDCATWHVAVKAANSGGTSPEFSNEISGWPRPVVTSATPASAKQGAQAVVEVLGSNFQSGASVDLGDSNIVLGSTSVLSCTRLQVLATVEPTAANVQPAQIGSKDVTISNPDDVFGMRAQGFEVLINPYRFDINRSDDATRDRIDGKDTIYLSRQFGLSQLDATFDPDNDFDGDGWVDGNDLAYIASNLGRCWSASTGSWTSAACPADLR